METRHAAGRVTGLDGSSTGRLERIRARFASSAWAPIAARLATYLAMFVALAAVGSGAAGGLLPAAGQDRSALAAIVEPLAAAATPAPSPPDAGPPDDASVEPAQATEAGLRDATGGDGGGITADGRVVLNTATEEELRRLPGIGPSKARAILALRAKLGRIRRPEDLLRVRGIGRRSLARLRPLLAVDPPPS